MIEILFKDHGTARMEIKPSQLYKNKNNSQILQLGPYC